MKYERAIEALGAALISDAKSEVRITAAWALGEIQSRKAVPILKEALSDPYQRVRDQVSWALTKILETDK